MEITFIKEATMASKLGLTKKANDIYFFLNKVNHTVNLLFFITIQLYLTSSDKLENYITCEELNNIKKDFLCQGFDITCVYECLDLCGYTKTCESCPTMK